MVSVSKTKHTRVLLLWSILVVSLRSSSHVLGYLHHHDWPRNSLDIHRRLRSEQEEENEEILLVPLEMNHVLA